MSTLNWRTVRDVRLTDKLIPEPGNESNCQNHLCNVRVAIEGAFLHIDPRVVDVRDPDPGSPEFSAYVVPMNAVVSVHYKEQKERPTPGAYTG